jgi:2-oxo-3-hexenedioate decarboxylase
MDRAEVHRLADRLIDAFDRAVMLESIAASEPSFDVDAAYAVLAEIHGRRVVSGWRPVGRKIGFTNRTIWERYGVDRPMWAHMYAHTVHHVANRRGSIGLAGFVQPRLEPEVVFGLRGPVPLTGDAREVLEAVDWIAPGFEIVQSHFPGWRFEIPDCTAAFGLHGALVVGPSRTIDDRARDRLAVMLPRFELTLSCGNRIVARGRGAHVLDSPALALQHLARLVASQPYATPLSAGEIVTTGTLTDAQPLTAGECWHSDYGDLQLAGIDLYIE